MSDLADKKCIPCEGNIPPFNIEEIHKYLKQMYLLIYHQNHFLYKKIQQLLYVLFLDIDIDEKIYLEHHFQ